MIGTMLLRVLLMDLPFLLLTDSAFVWKQNHCNCIVLVSIIDLCHRVRGTYKTSAHHVVRSMIQVLIDHMLVSVSKFDETLPFFILVCPCLIGKISTSQCLARGKLMRTSDYIRFNTIHMVIQLTLSIIALLFTLHPHPIHFLQPMQDNIYKHNAIIQLYLLSGRFCWLN